jgi:hypothetical protein
MLVEIVKQRMDSVARRAILVVAQNSLVSGVFLDQLARGEMVLKIDDHVHSLVERNF